MKSINTYITEKLNLYETRKTEHTLFPQTTKELREMIEEEIQKKWK